MAHHTLKSNYTSLVDRLNLFPQGAPPSKLLDKILTMLFSEKEAGRVLSRYFEALISYSERDLMSTHKDIPS